jgi:hypothetical protein
MEIASIMGKEEERNIQKERTKEGEINQWGKNVIM